MGTTENRQKEAKRDLDHKLALSTPDRQLLEELAVQCATKPSQASTFQYAFALSKSSEPSELRYAVNMLDSLVVEGKFEHQVDCMYGAATALYLLGDYEEARVSRVYDCSLVRAFSILIVEELVFLLTVSSLLLLLSTWCSLDAKRFCEHSQTLGLPRNCIWRRLRRKKKRGESSSKRQRLEALLPPLP